MTFAIHNVLVMPALGPDEPAPADFCMASSSGLVSAAFGAGQKASARQTGLVQSRAKPNAHASKASFTVKMPSTRDRGTEKPCDMSGLSSDFAGLLANWQRGLALQCRRA